MYRVIDHYGTFVRTALSYWTIDDSDIVDNVWRSVTTHQLKSQVRKNGIDGTRLRKMQTFVHFTERI
jgi:hypothetical protein